MLQRRKLDVRLEIGEDPILDEVVDASQKWDDGLAQSVADVVEAYLNGEVGIHVHVGIRAGLSKTQGGHYCTFFQRIGLEREILVKNLNVIIEHGESGFCPGRDAVNGRVNDTVLVEIGEPLEGAKDFGLRVVPSVARLQCLDRCSRLSRQDLELFVDGTGLGNVDDGEVDPLGVLRELPLRDLHNHRPNNVVEGRAQVMETIANEYAPLVRGMLVDFEAHDALSCIHVHLRNGFVGVAMSKPLNRLVQGLQVLVCPAESQVVTGATLQGSPEGRRMDKKDQEQVQKTKTGHEVPVPRRGDFLDNLKKVAGKPPKKSRRGKRRKKE